MATYNITINKDDWTKIADNNYQCLKTNNLLNDDGNKTNNIIFTFKDGDGNTLNVGTKITENDITYYYDSNILINVTATTLNDIQVGEYSYEVSNYPPSTYLNEDKGYIEENFIDDSGRPVVKHCIETHSVNPTNCSIQLTYDIDKYYNSFFDCVDGTYMNRVNNMEDLRDKSHSYYVGNNNMVYFTNDLVDKFVTCDYYGRGRTLINCNRIYYRDKINAVPVLLEELVDRGISAIPNLDIREIEDWKSDTSYKYRDLVKKDGLIYECIIEHTSSSDFSNDTNNWKQAINRFYVVTQSQYDSLISSGKITNYTKDIYIVI